MILSNENKVRHEMSMFEGTVSLLNVSFTQLKITKRWRISKVRLKQEYIETTTWCCISKQNLPALKYDDGGIDGFSELVIKSRQPTTAALLGESGFRGISLILKRTCVTMFISQIST